MVYTSHTAGNTSTQGTVFHGASRPGAINQSSRAKLEIQKCISWLDHGAHTGMPRRVPSIRMNANTIPETMRYVVEISRSMSSQTGSCGCRSALTAPITNTVTPTSMLWMVK